MAFDIQLSLYLLNQSVITPISFTPMLDTNNTVYTEIEILASPSNVWSVFTDWDKIGQWSSSIKGISVQEPVIGEEFVTYLKSPIPGRTIALRHVCTEYERDKILGWSGKIIGGTYDHHIYYLEATHRGTTIFKQEDGFHGPYSQILNPIAQTFMQILYNNFNRELKARVEFLFPI